MSAGGCPTVRAGIVSPAGVQGVVGADIEIVSSPPQTIISLPVQNLPCGRYRPAGALVMLVAVQLFVLGLYLPPGVQPVAWDEVAENPPQTIISLPLCILPW